MVSTALFRDRVGVFEVFEGGGAAWGRAEAIVERAETTTRQDWKDGILIEREGFR